MLCAICHIRKARRYCPGVRGQICTVCCGTEREVTVDCPPDCDYLQEARKHERTPPVDPAAFPNKDIQITEEFLQTNERLVTAAASFLLRAALDTPGAVDGDVRDALEALIRTYRTLESGVYYETRPMNALANRTYTALQEALAEFRKQEREELGMARTRDADILRVLVFLERLEMDRHNGRPKGRAFLDFLRSYFGGEERAAPLAHTSSLILP